MNNHPETSSPVPGIDVKILKLHPNADCPSYATEASAGADLRLLSEEPVTILPGATVLLHTGIAMEIPAGYAGFVFARSGLASKKGLAPANKVGVVDPDYRGEILVAMHNHGGIPQTLLPGERIAQIVFLPYAAARFSEAERLEESERGTGGFGSTGSK